MNTNPSVDKTSAQGQTQGVGTGDLVGRLRAHAIELASQLAECAGYLASVRTDVTMTDTAGQKWALQTDEWAEGAAPIAEKANEVLEKHDSLMLDAFCAECGEIMEAARQFAPDGPTSANAADQTRPERSEGRCL